MTDRPIPPPLARALAARDYNELTAVQIAVLGWDADERDLLVSARTGSGKTVAYGLGIAGTILGEAETLGEASAPVALIVAPTRELALQVAREFEWLYAQAGARITACVGGMDPRAERRQLEQGAHIVVGTPGRLRDHIERRALDLSNLKAVVLDEADEMLDLGFREDLEFILNKAPPERRTLLFSATLPRGIVALAKTYQRDALRIESSDGERGHADIEYRAIRVAPNEVEPAVVNLLRMVDAPSALVFCNTRDAVRHLCAILTERGFQAVYLSGELGQGERNKALQSLRDGRSRICVATDVAARGIDLPDLGLVIHAELPNDPEILQHRSGRTGRAGRKGISALIVPPAKRRRAENLLAEAGVEAKWGRAPSADEIRAQDRLRFRADPILTEPPDDEDRAMGEALLAEVPAADIAAALARLYRSRLPVPEEMGAALPERDGPHPRGDRAERMDRGERAPREDRPPRMQHASGPVVWFRADVGRRNKADPKWLLPMLCRRGKVQRTAIGAIRILDSVTEFEIAAEEADGFAASVKRVDGDDVHIERITGEASERPERPAKRDFSDKPRGKPSGDGFKGKPFKAKPFKERAAASPRDERSSGETRGFDKPAYEDRPFAKPAGKPFKGKPTGSFRDERTDDRPKSFGKPAFEDRPFGKPAGKPFKGKPSGPPREDRADGPPKDFSKAHRKGPGGSDKPQRSGPVKPGRGPDGPNAGFKKKKFKNRDA